MNGKMKRAALHNLGCKVNSYETEAMQQLLEQAGYEIVPFTQMADVYIINTCTVTNIADRKSRQMLNRARKMNPKAIVVAAGCYVQAAKEALKEEKVVDIAIGNNQKKDLISILNEYEVKHQKMEAVIDINHTKEYETLSSIRTAEHTRAFIKIQDGCNQFCSYCIIPYARGRARSRKPEDIIAEVRTLGDNGYQEIVLTGIHLSSYGIDFTADEQETLLGLIVRLHEIEGIKRIRLGSLEPGIITDKFVKTLAELDKFCPHFHLSLQSGCNETLKRMNRRYTAEEYYEKCLILRNYFSIPGITTDIIVGFPGETEEEFQITKEFLEKIGFSEIHVFKYSKRAGTKAAIMSEQVAEQVKMIRSNILIDLGNKMTEKFRDQFIGKKVEILLEEEITIAGKVCLAGHTREYVKAAAAYDQGRKQEIVTVVLAGKTKELVLLDERLCKLYGKYDLPIH